MIRTQRETGWRDKEAIWACARSNKSANWSGRERRKLVESSLPVAQIDFSQPITSTEEEGNRNKGNEGAFSSDQSAIAVTEGEEIEPKTVKDAECQTIELTTCFRQADIKPRIRTFFDTDVIVGCYTGLPSMEILIVVFEHVSSVTCHTANTVAQQIRQIKSSLLYLWNLDWNPPL